MGQLGGVPKYHCVGVKDLLLNKEQTSIELPALERKKKKKTLVNNIGVLT